MISAPAHLWFKNTQSKNKMYKFTKRESEKQQRHDESLWREHVFIFYRERVSTVIFNNALAQIGRPSHPHITYLRIAIIIIII